MLVPVQHRAANCYSQGPTPSKLFCSSVVGEWSQVKSWGSPIGVSLAFRDRVLSRLKITLIEARMPTPKSRNTKTNKRIYANCFKKFAWTLPCFPVTWARNPADIVQNNFFRWLLLFRVHFGGWVSSSDLIPTTFEWPLQITEMINNGPTSSSQKRGRLTCGPHTGW